MKSAFYAKQLPLSFIYINNTKQVHSFSGEQILHVLGFHIKVAHCILKI